MSAALPLGPDIPRYHSQSMPESLEKCVPSNSRQRSMSRPEFGIKICNWDQRTPNSRISRGTVGIQLGIWSTHSQVFFSGNGFFQEKGPRESTCCRMGNFLLVFREWMRKWKSFPSSIPKFPVFRPPCGFYLLPRGSMKSKEIPGAAS